MAEPITMARQVVFHLLDDGPLPTYLYLPGNLEELPCYVVGRPEVAEGVARSIAQVSVPVFTCGRTVRDDDAQAELDRYADLVVTRFWFPTTREGIAVRLSRTDPTTVIVAGTEVPAYTATVVCETALC